MNRNLVCIQYFKLITWVELNMNASLKVQTEFWTKQNELFNESIHNF